MSQDEITPARLRELAKICDPPVNHINVSLAAPEIAAALRAAASALEAKDDETESALGYIDRNVIRPNGGTSLPDLMGVCVQVDHITGSLRATLAAREALLRRVLEHLDTDIWLNSEDELAAEIAAALGGKTDV